MVVLALLAFEITSLRFYSLFFFSFQIWHRLNLKHLVSVTFLQSEILFHPYFVIGRIGVVTATEFLLVISASMVVLLLVVLLVPSSEDIV